MTFKIPGVLVRNGSYTSACVAKPANTVCHAGVLAGGRIGGTKYSCSRCKTVNLTYHEPTEL